MTLDDLLERAREQTAMTSSGVRAATLQANLDGETIEIDDVVFISGGIIELQLGA